MKRKYLFVTLLSVTILTISCTKPVSKNDVNKDAISPTVTNEIAEPIPFTLQEEYIALVESYMGEVSVRQIEESKCKELSDILQGHYDIIGRTAGEDRNYYIATRREDALVYDDFDSINLGYYSEGMADTVFQIGYYDKEDNSKILYEMEGYDLIEFPLGSSNLDCFCFVETKSLYENKDKAFLLSFTKSGRSELDFIRKYTGLSVDNAGSSYIEFYYQDKDTINFNSGPYSCYINISMDEAEDINQLLSSSKVIEEEVLWKDVWQYLSEEDESIRSTGVMLHMEDKQYNLLGNKNSTGYILNREKEQGFSSLEYNEAVYGFVMNKIQNVMKRDYGSFDAQWFKTPLKSAAIEFSERVNQMDGSHMTDLRLQTVTDLEKLSALAKLMDHAINDEEVYGFSACPYIASIEFTREDGEVLHMFIATDSCDSMTYEGRIGFEYGKQSDLAEIFDKAMRDRLIN